MSYRDCDPFEVCLDQTFVDFNDIRSTLIIINSYSFLSMVKRLAIEKHVRFNVTPPYLISMMY